MSSLPRIQIERSVGYRAQNNIADVRKVQTQLNLLLDPKRTKLVEDGFYGPNTKERIGDFQSHVLGFQFPDFRVDPGAKTIRALNDPGSKEKWTVTPDKPDPDKPDKPNKPDPVKPVSPEDMPKIPVHGPTDLAGGFDTYPAPAQVLGPSKVSTPVDRDGAWIMIPHGSERSIRLGISSDEPVQFVSKGFGEDGVVRSFKKEELIKVSVTGQTLTIKGLNPCKNCKLDLVQDGRHLRIYVSVKPLRVVPLFVFHVEHGPGMKSRVSSSELRTVLKIANSEILRPQCNVEFDLKGQTELSHKDIGKHLGAIVRGDGFDDKKDEFKYLRPFLKDRTFSQPHGADHVKTVNLFIVRNMRSTVEEGKRPVSVWGAMNSASGMCVMRDRSIGRFTGVNGLAHTLCHEVGHMLIGQIYTHGHDIVQPESHNPFTDALMYSGGKGNKLYRVEVEAMNPTRHQPPPLSL
ncbi:hypothetical protein [Roseibium sp.]|uniref:hypothetical protein n=1 Tax=Roseibium sp. TaxID=1936156 RepID=UPI003B50BD1C